MKTTHTPTAARTLYLIEFYANHPQTLDPGWEIHFAWVFAADSALATAKLKAHRGRRFDCFITCEQQSEIFPLVGNFRVNTRDANLFIIH